MKTKHKSCELPQEKKPWGGRFESKRQLPQQVWILRDPPPSPLKSTMAGKVVFMPKRF